MNLGTAEGLAFRRHLQAAMAPAIEAGAPVALLFSGGTDSLTILWALQDLGITPRCYTFRLASYLSDDAKVARIAAQTFNVPLEEIVIPHRAPDALRDEVRTVVQTIRSARKTHVECAFPFWHMRSHISEPVIFTGLGADDLWGTTRSVAIKYGHDPLGFHAARTRAINDPNASGIQQITSLFDDRLQVPYRDPAVCEYMLRFNWQQLNRPRQKMLAVYGFAAEFATTPLYRRNANLQVGSRVREYLATIRHDQSVPVQRIYRQMLEGAPA